MAELSYGQKAVGIKFNHAEGEAHDDVQDIKQAFADMIDYVEGKRTATDSRFANTLKTYAVQTLIAAQMAVVKVATWKDEE